MKRLRWFSQSTLSLLPNTALSHNPTHHPHPHHPPWVFSHSLDFPFLFNPPSYIASFELFHLLFFIISALAFERGNEIARKMMMKMMGLRGDEGERETVKRWSWYDEECDEMNDEQIEERKEKREKEEKEFEMYNERGRWGGLVCWCVVIYGFLTC